MDYGGQLGGGRASFVGDIGLVGGRGEDDVAMVVL